MPKNEPVVAVTNVERMEALEQQRKQLENSFQRISGAIELLQAIIDSDKIQAIEERKNDKKKK